MDLKYAKLYDIFLVSYNPPFPNPQKEDEEKHGKLYDNLL